MKSGSIKATISKEKVKEIRKKLGFLNDRDSFKIDF